MSVICHLSMECSLVCLVSHVYITAQSGEQKANKSEGDPALRVSFEKPEWNDLTELISKMAEAHKKQQGSLLWLSSKYLFLPISSV